MKLSIVIPCFNEVNTIEQILLNIKKFYTDEKEIIIVDDCSTDGTKEVLQNLRDTNEIKLIFLKKNYGKGFALKTGFKEASGEIIVTQDADLEYDPRDYENLLIPFKEANADVVYGSRFLGSRYNRLHYFSHYIANKILTCICNIVTNLNMTDMETGYKLFKREVINSIEINEKSFGVEPEITVKLAKKGFKFFEVPISYNGRSYSEGKKITAKDGIFALICIFRYRFF
tara:strand:- start:489 stop:1175 length:687 start_codon:yes stop_codon:yes gene_type:complete